MRPGALLLSLGAAVASAAFPCEISAQSLPIDPPAHFHKLAHTYSIVAWDAENGDLGVAVQSKFPNVGGLVLRRARARAHGGRRIGRRRASNPDGG